MLRVLFPVDAVTVVALLSVVTVAAAEDVVEIMGFVTVVST